MIGDTQQMHPPFISAFNIASTKLTTSGDREKVFTNEDEQLKHWFIEFSDDQKRIILHDLLSLCRKEHLDQMEISFRKTLGKIRCNFTKILPHSLVLYLFSFCDPRTLVNLSQVSWFCKLLADSNEVWLEKCRQKNWNLPGSEWQMNMPSKFWKRFYMEKQRMTSKQKSSKVLLLRMLEGTGRLTVGNRSPSPILGTSGALLSVNTFPKLPSNSPSSETKMKQITVGVGGRFCSVPQPTRPREHYPISNPYFERLNLVPRCYFTGRESCQKSPERLVSLHARRIQSEQQRQLTTQFRRPWLPTSRTGLSRPRSSEAGQVRPRRTAVKQKYSLCRKIRSTSMSGSQKPENTTIGQDSDDVRYADVFGKPFTNDTGRNDQFSAWNYAVDRKICRLNPAMRIDCNGRDPECTLPHRTLGSGTGDCSSEVTITPEDISLSQEKQCCGHRSQTRVQRTKLHQTTSTSVHLKDDAVSPMSMPSVKFSPQKCFKGRQDLASESHDQTLTETPTQTSDVTNGLQLLRQTTEHLSPAPVIRESECNDTNPINIVLARPQET